MKLLVTGGLGFIGSNFILNTLSKHPEFEITNISIGSGWVYNNISVDVAAIFGSVEYMYTDLFTPQGQTASTLERVNESNAVLKATLKYSF